MNAKLYHAAALGEVDAVNLALRVRGAAPGSFAGRLREISASVDPNLQVRSVMSLDEALRPEQSVLRSPPRSSC